MPLGRKRARWGNKVTKESKGYNKNTYQVSSVQFSRSVVSDSVTPWTAACQDSLSIINSRSLLKLMSIESVMPSNHLILCRPLLLPSIFPSIRIISNESVLCITWPKYWSFRFSISSSNEYSGLISFGMDWLDLRLSYFTFTFHFHALEKEMATHSSVLAWRIPETGKPGGLLSLGSHRVGHDWSDLAAASALVLPMNIQDWFPSGWTGWMFIHTSLVPQGLAQNADSILFFNFPGRNLGFTSKLKWEC